MSIVERAVFLLSVALATFMMVLDYSIANVSIPYIAGDLGVSNDEGTYVITSFAVGNAVGLAITGWLTKCVGQVRLITLSVVLFVLFSWLCGLSFSLETLVINRFIQGFVAGPIIPLSQSLLINQGTAESRMRDLAIWSSIVITAPVLGPVLGGYISEWHYWPWIFYINIPIGIFCAIALWNLLKGKESPIERQPLDMPGFILLLLGVTCLQIFLDKGQQWDWFNSNLIRMLVIGVVVCFTFLTIRELSHKKALLDFKLFGIPSFTISIFCLLLSYAMYFGTVVIVPLWLQQDMGYTAGWAGAAVCALGIAPVCLSTSTPWIMKNLGNILTLLLSFVIFALSCFVSAFLTTDVDILYVSFCRFLFGFGFICYINPLLSLSVQDIPTEQLPSATGIFHFFRAMVGGIGTSIFTTLWDRRTIFHHERIGESLTRFNPTTPQDLNLAQLNALVDQQASMLAINDAFYVMGWLFTLLCAVLILWYILDRKATPRADSSVISVE